jgi:predicted N-formylglutamate amidohydrolase
VTPKDLAPADAPYEVVAPGAGSDVLLLCDHASNRVPPCIAGGSLGLDAGEMARHIAYDIGARGVTLGLSERLHATAILSRFSRLVIDPNRGEDDPTLVMRLYDGTIVPANRRVAPEEVERRLAAFHRPYHVAVDREIDRRLAAGRPPLIMAIHSFTPKLIAGRPRPWHIGVLWHHDGRVALPLIERLRREPDLCVGENEPYDGQLEGDTLSRHGTRRGLPHVLIELRHDLIDSEAGEAVWAERLAPILADVADEVRGGALQSGET